MGKYTSLDDPQIDHLVELHLRQIVESVLDHFEPFAIVLRGSFGRGEGSVMLANDRPMFLSDYEIDVITNSPLHRSLLANLTRELSEEFGMAAGLRWNRKDCLTKRRLGPIVVGKAPISISLYEFRYGSQILWGEDFISQSPQIDPGQIQVESGIQLMLNRMAESLFYMPAKGDQMGKELEFYYWINKTILSCGESLLVLWKQYHFSYAERGRRFSILAQDHLDFMPESRKLLIDLVARATEFKLRPKAGLYNDSIRDTWLQVISICNDVFRHLAEQGTNLSFPDYTEYPQEILNEASRLPFLKIAGGYTAERLLELNKALRARSLPRSLPIQLLPSQIVYAIVPLMFLCYGSSEPNGMLRESRYWLSKLRNLLPESSDPEDEWNYLRQQLADCWKIYCY